jgi:hypothetical protein
MSEKIVNGNAMGNGQSFSSVVLHVHQYFVCTVGDIRRDAGQARLGHDAYTRVNGLFPGMAFSLHKQSMVYSSILNPH